MTADPFTAGQTLPRAPTHRLPAIDSRRPDGFSLLPASSAPERTLPLSAVADRKAYLN